MTKDEKLDEFMKRIGIELSPFQKEIIKKIADENKIYMCYCTAAVKKRWTRCGSCNMPI